MASFTISARAEQHANVRPLSILRDLPAVADLIEMCFSSTMDNDGKRYVQDMRRAGKDNSFLQWANRAAESTSLPLTGYVWEENGRIVGNASLFPFRNNHQRVYLNLFSILLLFCTVLSLWLFPFATSILGLNSRLFRLAISIHAIFEKSKGTEDNIKDTLH